MWLDIKIFDKEGNEIFYLLLSPIILAQKIKYLKIILLKWKIWNNPSKTLFFDKLSIFLIWINIKGG